MNAPSRRCAAALLVALVLAACHPFENTDDYPYPGEDGDVDGAGGDLTDADLVDGAPLDLGDVADGGDDGTDVVVPFLVDAGPDGRYAPGVATPLEAQFSGAPQGVAIAVTWSAPQGVSVDDLSAANTFFIVDDASLGAITLSVTACLQDASMRCASDSVTFEPGATILFVDSTATPPGAGTQDAPFSDLETALAAADELIADGAEVQLRLAARRDAPYAVSHAIETSRLHVSGTWDADAVPWVSAPTARASISGPIVVSSARRSDATTLTLTGLDLRGNILADTATLTVHDSEVVLSHVRINASTIAPSTLYIDGASTVRADDVQIQTAQCNARHTVTDPGAEPCVEGVVVTGGSTLHLANGSIAAPNPGENFVSGLTRLVRVDQASRLVLQHSTLKAEVATPVLAPVASDKLVVVEAIGRSTVEISGGLVEAGGGHGRQFAAVVLDSTLSATDDARFVTGPQPTNLSGLVALAVGIYAGPGSSVSLDGGQVTVGDAVLTPGVSTLSRTESFGIECQQCELLLEGVDVRPGAATRSIAVAADSAERVELNDTRLLSPAPYDAEVVLGGMLPEFAAGLRVRGGRVNNDAVFAPRFAPVSGTLECCDPARFNVIVRGGRIEGGVARLTRGVEISDQSADSGVDQLGDATVCIDGASISGGAAPDTNFGESIGVNARGLALWLHNSIVFGGGRGQTAIATVLRGRFRAVAHNYLFGGHPSGILGSSYGLVADTDANATTYSVLNNVLHAGHGSVQRAFAVAALPDEWRGNAYIEQPSGAADDAQCRETLQVDCTVASESNSPTENIRLPDASVAACALDLVTEARDGTWRLPPAGCTALSGTGHAVYARPGCALSCHAPLTDIEQTPRYHGSFEFGSNNDTCATVELEFGPNSRLERPDIGPDEQQ